MSYILDALRRADAERQRGTVPGLHDLPLDSTLNDAPPPPATRSRRLGLAALALAVLGLAGAAGWLLRPVGQAAGGPDATAGPLSGDRAPDPAAGKASALDLPQPAAPAPAPALTAAQAPTQAAPAAALPAPARSLAPANPRPVPPPGGPSGRVPPAPVVAAAPLRPPEPASSLPAAPTVGPALAAASRPAPTPLATTTPPVRLPTLAELSEAQKRELGPLVVGGAMHGEQAALRIVILNGQVMHEGDKLGPDLQVQQIRLKSVVLSHRGQRFELPF